MKFQSKYDSPVFLVVFILLVIGIVMVYSASSFKAQERYNDSNYFLKFHFQKVLLGLAIMVVIAKIDYTFWLKISPLFLAVCFCSLIYLLVSDNVAVVRGSRRWLTIGSLKFQPSDFARMSLILFLCFTLGKIRLNKNNEHSLGFFIFHLFIIGCVVTPIILQPDIGTASLIAFIAIMILFISGEKLRYLFAVALTSVPYYILFIMQKGYPKDRIINYLASLKGEPVDWQNLQSLIALGNGHVFGLGLGSSRQKFHFLPDPFTDFIYAIVGEELGIIGTTLILLLLILLIWSGFKISRMVQEPHAKILAAAIVIHIAVYAFANIGVVVNLLPTTGLPMPFLSYGGSALLVNLFAVGVLLNISTKIHSNKRLVPAANIYQRSNLKTKHG